jgi:WxL domain surface cell wall-binding
MFSHRHHDHLTHRVALGRTAVALGIVCAFAVAPVAADAGTTAATGTLSAGGLSVVAPSITPFTAILTGVDQTVNTSVGAWSLTDAIGDGAAYNVSVSAGPPSIGGTSIAGSLGGTWLALTPTTATADASNPAPASTHPVAIAGSLAVGATAVTIENAAVNTGAGKWDFAADSGGVANLAITIPGNAVPGAYSDTLTYTIAAGVGT